MNEVLLAARGVSVGAGKAAVAQGITFEVRAGEIWAVIGQNGAGKTLLLETLVGLLAAHTGEVELAGKLASDWRPREAARMRAYLPQGVGEPAGISVIELAMLGRHPYLSRWAWEGEGERRAAIDALEMVGMSHMAEREVSSLSQGERQRAAIAALIAQDTPLLILDEPLSHLDVHHRIGVFGQLARLAHRKRKAVVMTVHDLDLAARFATHVLLYRGDGEVAAGTASAVLTSESVSQAFMHPIVRAFAGQRPVFVSQ